eukprot:gene13340-biopygen978
MACSVKRRLLRAVVSQHNVPVILRPPLLASAAGIARKPFATILPPFTTSLPTACFRGGNPFATSLPPVCHHFANILPRRCLAGPRDNIRRASYQARSFQAIYSYGDFPKIDPSQASEEPWVPSGKHRRGCPTPARGAEGDPRLALAIVRVDAPEALAAAPAFAPKAARMGRRPASVVRQRILSDTVRGITTAR